MKRGTTILALTIVLAATATGLIYLYLKGAGDVTDAPAEPFERGDTGERHGTDQP